jgi:hypothetical protein
VSIERRLLYGLEVLEQRHRSLRVGRGGLSEVIHGFARVVDAFRATNETHGRLSPFRRLV